MSCQCLCGTETADSAHIVQEVRVQNLHSNMQQVKALIDCSAKSILISLSILRKLELPHELAFTSTQGLNGQLMMSGKESRKESLLVQYFEHL